MFVHSLRAASQASSIGAIVLVVPPGEILFAKAGVEEFAGDAPVAAVVDGGASRRESAAVGIAAAPPSPLILIHDAARPFAPPSLFDRVAKAVREPFAGAVPVVESADTVKRVRDGRIVETLPREELGLVQTPQAFAAAALREAHDAAAREDWSVTDDAMLLERAGLDVAVVAGELLNFKITTEADLRRAELLVVSGEAGQLP
jgi:2-C-methyl-D-erythritol 4-phosphate cytidylyltransferase